jgi:hypothetical protein
MLLLVDVGLVRLPLTEKYDDYEIDFVEDIHQEYVLGRYQRQTRGQKRRKNPNERRVIQTMGMRSAIWTVSLMKLVLLQNAV